MQQLPVESWSGDTWGNAFLSYDWPAGSTCRTPCSSLLCHRCFLYRFLISPHKDHVSSFRLKFWQPPLLRSLGDIPSETWWEPHSVQRSCSQAGEGKGLKGVENKVILSNRGRHSNGCFALEERMCLHHYQLLYVEARPSSPSYQFLVLDHGNEILPPHFGRAIYPGDGFKGSITGWLAPMNNLLRMAHAEDKTELNEQETFWRKYWCKLREME